MKMKKLKTLNDMYGICHGRIGDFLSDLKSSKKCEEYVDITKLRQEAIKWIKKGQKHPELVMLELYDGYFPLFKVIPLPRSMGKSTGKIISLETVEGVKIPQAFGFITRWIKHFFNITEEDLK